MTGATLVLQLAAGFVALAVGPFLAVLGLIALVVRWRGSRLEQRTELTR